jgi:hypothetical protein
MNDAAKESEVTRVEPKRIVTEHVHRSEEHSADRGEGSAEVAGEEAGRTSEVGGDRFAFMSYSELIRWSGLAAVVASTLFIIGDLLGIFAIGFVSGSVSTAFFVVVFVLYLLGAALLLVGLVGLYVRQLEATGALGIVGFLVAFLGTVLLAGAAWAQVFIVPLLPSSEVTGLLQQNLGTVLMTVVFAAGWLLFGVATHRGRVYPRVAAIVLMVGAVIAALPIPLLPGGIVLYVGIAWLGFVLFTGRGASA